MPLSGSSQDLTITQGVLALGAFDLTVADVLTVDANGDITCTTGTITANSETGAGLPYSCGGNWTPTVASAIADTTVSRDASPIDNYRDLKAVFTDVEDGSALTYTIQSNTNSGLVTPTIVVADSTLDLSFTASTSGTATITIRATDSGSSFVEDVFTVTVNDAPTVASAIADTTVNENDPPIVNYRDLKAVFTDVEDGSGLTYTIQSNTNSGLVTPTIVAADSTLDLSFTASTSGTATITIRATDSFSSFVDDVFTVTVNGTPTVASAIADTTVAMDNPHINNYRDLKAVFTDAEDGSALTYTIQSNTNSGLVTPTIVVADSTLDLSFTASTSGTATITIRATDSFSSFVDDVFTVTVNGTPTVASAIADTTVAMDNPPINNYRDLKAVFTDAEDGSALTYTIQSNTNSGLVTPTIVVADSTLDLSFTASATGTATITIRATDSGALFVDDVFTVTVTAGDATPPDDVANLATGTVTTSSVALSWTSPGDDGATGTATTYDVRYSTSPINPGNWDSAIQASGEPSPQVAGSSESFTVTGLSAGTTYYFAIKTSDEVPNESVISNLPSGTTSASAGVTFQQGDGKADNASDTDDAKIIEGSPTNNYGGTDDLEIDEGDLHSVVKFPNLFGGGVDQIPLGSLIISATLTLEVFNSGDDPLVYQLIESWVESQVTWNNRSTGVGWTSTGADGTGSRKASAVGTLPAGSTGSTSVDVTASVQNWSFGELNEGWLLEDTGSGGVDTRTSEYGTASERPMLTVSWAANTAPAVAAAIPDTTVNENNVAIDNYRDLKAVFSDVEEGSALTYTIQSNTNSGLVTPTIVAADSTLDLSFTASTTGTATITIRATDSGALFVDDVFTVTVNGPPTVASAIADTTVSRDAAPIDNYRDLKAVFTDVEDGSALTYTIQSNTNSGLVTPTIIAADSTLDLSFTASTSGTATITIRATDSGALFVDDVFTVTVNGPPTVASAIADTTVSRDAAPIDNYRDLKAVFTDVEDGSALTYTIQSNTNSGLVTPSIIAADSTLDLSFTASTSGTATITMRATDSGGLFVDDVFTVTVNDAPTVASAIADTTVSRNAAPIDNYRDLKAVFTDVEDGSGLTYTIQSNTNSGLVTPTIVAADSTLDLSFTASTTGTATITIRATDSGSLFVDDVFTVTVNSPPAVLLGRYWFNEAPSGQAVATVLDDQASPVNLAVTYDTLEWRSDAGHRGLGVPVAGRTNNLQHAGIASAAVEGTKYKTNLNGATAATFVVVAEWEGGWSDRVAGFQRPGGGRVLLVLTDAGGGLEFRTDSDNSNPRMIWESMGWDDGVPRVFHFVYDTDHATDSLRMRLYVDGVDQGIPSNVQSGLPTLGDGLNWGFTDIELIALNEPDFTNGFPGTVFYMGVYAGVMTDGEITSDVAALLADDDNVTYAVDVTLNGVDSLPRLPSNGTSYPYKYTVTNNSSVLEDFDLFGYPGDTLATFLTVDSIIGPNVTGGATADSARITGVPASGVDSAFVWYSVANVTAGTLDSLYLNSRSFSDTTVSDPGWAFIEVVKPNMTTLKGVSPNGTVLPGTELTYTVTITNDGSEDATGVVVLDSVAVELDFKVGSVVNNLPSGVNATVEYSDDAGSTWTYTPVSAGCSAPANFDSCVTHIRWTLDNDLSHVGPNNTGNVQFVTRIQ